MKAIAYIVFIFLLLSGGSGKSYATTLSKFNYSKSVNEINESRQINFTNKNHNSILLQESEIDLEEEFNQTHRFKNNSLEKLDFEKYQFSNQFYSTLITHIRLDNFLYKNKNFGLPNPIYITLQVFRI